MHINNAFVLEKQYHNKVGLGYRALLLIDFIGDPFVKKGFRTGHFMIVSLNHTLCTANIADLGSAPSNINWSFRIQLNCLQNRIGANYGGLYIKLSPEL